jgi:hypothetical protein
MADPFIYDEPPTRPPVESVPGDIVRDPETSTLYYLSILGLLIAIVVLLALLFAWTIRGVNAIRNFDNTVGNVVIVGQNTTLNTTIVGPLGDQPADDCVCVTIPADQPPIPVTLDGDLNITAVISSINATIESPLGSENRSTGECLCVTIPDDQPPIDVFVANDSLSTIIESPLGDTLTADQCVCVTYPTDQAPIPVAFSGSDFNFTINVEPLSNISISEPLGDNLVADQCVCVTYPTDQAPLPVIIESSTDVLNTTIVGPLGDTLTADQCVCVTFGTDQAPLPVTFDGTSLSNVTIIGPIGNDILSNESVSVTIAADQTAVPVSLGNLVDDFGRLKVANPDTVFDSKLLSNESDTDFWDSAQTSGTGTSYTYNKARASVTLGVTAVTAGVRVRQTFRYMNYQSGRSQSIFLTAVVGSSGTGILKRWGYFDDGDGLFFQLNNGVFSVVLRSNVTGTPVDTVVPQSSFDNPVPDGWSVDDATIYGIDFQWLGVGDARFFIMRHETFTYIYTFHGEDNTNAYMSSPNLPVRYELHNSGAGAAATLECICVTVYSEGGQSHVGIEFSANRAASLLTLTTDGVDHSVIAIRKAPTSRHTHAGVIGITAVTPSGNTFYIWKLNFRPVMAGAALTWQNLAGSNIQFAVPVSANTVTGGIVTNSGYISATNQAIPISAASPQTFFLGNLIDGTPLEYHLSVQRLDATGGSSTFLASISYLEV